MGINVLLSGRLKLDGYGQGRPENGDGTFRLALPEGSTVEQVIQGMGVPSSRFVSGWRPKNRRRCPAFRRARPRRRRAAGASRTS
jgi:hypothetical protein